jgi:hypothetical protein
LLFDSSNFFHLLIQVIVGKKNEQDVDEQQEGPWYFSLNNRRLWVLKRCREEGLLQSSNNRIRVRVRAPKSAAERDRYIVEKCALEAKIVPEKTSAAPGLLSKKNDKASIKRGNDIRDCDDDEETPSHPTTAAASSSSAIDDVPLSSQRKEEVMVNSGRDSAAADEDEDDDDSSSSSSSCSGFASTNPFSLLS